MPHAPAPSPPTWVADTRTVSDGGPPDLPSRGAADRLSPWQHGWRLVLVWVLGLGVWLFVGTVATDGWRSDVDAPGAVEGLLLLDLALGHLALVVVACRRRWPVGVALVTGLLCLFSAMAAPVSLLALVSLATRRRWPALVLVTVVNLLVDTFYELVVSPVLGLSDAVLTNLGFAVLVYAICVLVGWNIGSRRELVRSWRAEASTANREQAARVAQAQLAERARIAREMHDVLAHRLSLVAMHAGALAHRPDLSEDERKEAAEVVRAGAHLALDELREVLGVLRADDRDDVSLSPQPGLSGIPSLVAEVTSSGQEVHLRADPSLWLRSVSLPGSTGRHAYRLVQEALTNARRHAARAATTVELDGRPGGGLSIQVSNPVPGRVVASGDGRGLAGMKERVQLAGGRFGAGQEGERFVVRARLPWPEQEEPA